MFNPIADPSSASQQDILPVLPASTTIQLLRTLVVDPDLEAAMALMGVVASRGHESAHCSTFEEAAEIIRQTPPDCLIIRLNHDTAPAAAELVRQIRALPGQCYVAAVTDTEEQSSRVEAWVKRGFDDFFADPRRFGHATALTRLAVAEYGLLRRREQDRVDIEAAKHSRRYEEIFHRGPNAALVVTAREGIIVETNAAAEQILGIARTELLQRYLSLVLPDLFDRDDYDPRTIAISDTVQLKEVKHQRADNTRRWLDVVITRIPWTPGQALLLKFHDVTAIKDRESRRVHDARLESAGRVMAGAARELGDALTAIRANLEMMLSEPPARLEQREFLQNAQDATMRAAELGRRLGSLARAPHGGDLRKRPLHLKPVIERAVPFALLNTNSRPVLHIPDDLWAVDADESSLFDVLQRLTQNAAESMSAGGTVFVDAVNIRQPGDERSVVRIRVRDQGQGVAPAQQGKLFDPWFTTRPGREGMGLTVVAAAMRAHGGHVEIDSTLGHGSTVTLWLPVDARLLTGDEPTTRAPLTESMNPLPTLPTRQAPRRHRILFMDDEAAIRSVVLKILTAHGYDVHCTCDGQEAINAYRRARDFGSPFDLMLVDLDVRGGMGGQEAVARLHGEFPGLKALLTTGFIDDILMETYRDHGFLGVIPKPFQLDRLVQSIGRLLGAPDSVRDSSIRL